MKRVLVVGLGNMGSLHWKYLNKMNDVEFFWYDPHVDATKAAANKSARVTNLDEVNSYTHIIITSRLKLKHAD